MLCLALETSGRTGSVAVVRREEDGSMTRLAERESTPPRGHGGPLMVELEALLQEAGLSVRDVSLFAANVGPGSFTGIRVGLSAVNAMAWSLGRAACGVNGLLALAHNVSGAAVIAPVLDARKGEVFGALYRRTDAGYEELLAPVAMKPAAFVEAVSAQSPVFVGSGVGTYPDVFGPERFAPAIRASTVAELALDMAAREALAPAQPVYVRPSEAEVKFGAAPAHDAMDNLI